ncbi:hypothetical protein B0A48_11903 [Cryoendolithus antarcticus]|uniref:Alkyl hydroperoxide reductase subunit C/ Thiol specific antioxidant domain-containing protein n=1 Tax=Cryoendolithus antarcticus TaxID=1507870 RepID=A0A1V8STG2_9PEZI|nr:hypothetical protein B0A48_11903 [Cryoendolithus antarcticus]
MTFQQELGSWLSTTAPSLPAAPPTIGSSAPDHPKLLLGSNKSAIITFLRHCGCPFAEKTFLNLREVARSNSDLDFIAVSHSSHAATETWLKSLPQAGSEPDNLRVIVDEQREIYAAWGLGVSSYAHVLSPASMWSVWKLGKEEGIWNRPTESGSRWQMAGSFGVDGEGVVRWGGVAGRADEKVDFEEGVRVLEASGQEAKL